MSCSLTLPDAAADTPLLVLKFGSSVLRDAGGFSMAAADVAREVGAGGRVLVVVSAMGNATERLLSAAHSVCPDPPNALLGLLLSTGEDASVALMTMSLGAAGVQAAGLGASELALRTTGPVSDADPIGVDVDRIEALFRLHQAVVVPGFVGRDRLGSPSLLGRGGSDLTALFLGHVLSADRVFLVKDVDGVFPSDPRHGPPESSPLARASWEVVQRIGGGVVQPKALRFAAHHGLAFRVGAMGAVGTWVGLEVESE